jgi:hypothetical protein
MFNCSKLILRSALTALFVLSATPVWAGSEIFLTGGGVIRDGRGPDARKITFSVDLFATQDGQNDGQIQFQFHRVGNPDLDKSRFTANDFSEFSVYTNESETLGIYQFIRIWAHGQLNGEDGWSVLLRVTDFGTPVGGKDKLDGRVDAVRIMLFEPDGDAVYDTAQDYPREQGWRALLDGGNVVLHFSFDSTVP